MTRCQAHALAARQPPLSHVPSFVLSTVVFTDLLRRPAATGQPQGNYVQDSTTVVERRRLRLACNFVRQAAPPPLPPCPTCRGCVWAGPPWGCSTARAARACPKLSGLAATRVCCALLLCSAPLRLEQLLFNSTTVQCTRGSTDNPSHMSQVPGGPKAAGPGTVHCHIVAHMMSVYCSNKQTNCTVEASSSSLGPRTYSSTGIIVLEAPQKQWVRSVHPGSQSQSQSPWNYL